MSQGLYVMGANVLQVIDAHVGITRYSIKDRGKPFYRGEPGIPATQQAPNS